MSEKPAADALPLTVDADGRIIISVRVIPRAPATRIDGLRNGALLVKLTAPPVDSAANDALVEFFATLLRCPRRQIQLVAGEKSRDKRLAVAGLALQGVASRLREKM